jgi:hypothetical protein
MLVIYHPGLGYAVFRGFMGAKWDSDYLVVSGAGSGCVWMVPGTFDDEGNSLVRYDPV